MKPLALLFFAVGSMPFNLDKEVWRNRVLVVFAPAGDDRGLRAQRQIADEEKEGFRQRDLLFIEVVRAAPTKQVPASVARELRGRLRAPEDKFQVVLIGKDGSVKLRRTEPVPAKELFDTIDVMPMRQQELRPPR